MKKYKLYFLGKKHEVYPEIYKYSENGNLAIQLMTEEAGFPEPWSFLTVNLGATCPENCAFVDINNNGEEILDFITNNNIGKPTGRYKTSGFVTYPEFEFTNEFLNKGEKNMKNEIKTYSSKKELLEIPEYTGYTVREKAYWEIHEYIDEDYQEYVQNLFEEEINKYKKATVAKLDFNGARWKLNRYFEENPILEKYQNKVIKIKILNSYVESKKEIEISDGENKYKISGIIEIDPDEIKIRTDNDSLWFSLI